MVEKVAGSDRQEIIWLANEAERAVRNRGRSRILIAMTIGAALLTVALLVLRSSEYQNEKKLLESHVADQKAQALILKESNINLRVELDEVQESYASLEAEHETQTMSLLASAASREEEQVAALEAKLESLQAAYEQTQSETAALKTQLDTAQRDLDIAQRSIVIANEENTLLESKVTELVEANVSLASEVATASAAVTEAIQVAPAAVRTQPTFQNLRDVQQSLDSIKRANPVRRFAIP